MWRKACNIAWDIIDECLCVKAKWNNLNFCLPPFGLDRNQIVSVADKMQKYFTDLKQSFVIKGVTQELAAIFQKERPEKYLYTYDRDDFDYVYNTKDLIELKGRKYHSKKNHINSFRRCYSSYKYMKLSIDLAQQCIITEREWYKKHEGKNNIMLFSEKNAIIEALENLAQLKLSGGAILINNKVEAFTIGELLNNNTVIIHIEKGNSDFRGIYPTINWEFCRNEWENTLFVNRAEDMGLEGLRKSKESYYPVKMIKKFIMTLK